MSKMTRYDDLDRHTDEEIVEWLLGQGWKRKRELPDGTTECYDPVTQLWLPIDHMPPILRARFKRRRILGSWADTRALNRAGL